MGECGLSDYIFLDEKTEFLTKKTVFLFLCKACALSEHFVMQVSPRKCGLKRRGEGEAHRGYEE